MTGIISGETQPASGLGMREIFRTLGAILGLCMIGFGGYWSIKFFFLMVRIMEVPQKMDPLVKSWRAFLNLDTLKITLGQTVINVDSRFVPIFVLGAGAFILIFLSIKFTMVGAALLSSMVTDVEILKKMLSKTLNPREVSSSAPSHTEQT